VGVDYAGAQVIPVLGICDRCGGRWNGDPEKVLDLLSNHECDPAKAKAEREKAALSRKQEQAMTGGYTKKRRGVFGR